MNALEKNVAVARGEALAASLLASLAIQAILVMVANREEFLTKMEVFIDETLNLSGPGGGDAHDEPNTLMRETARDIAMKHLDGIKTMLNKRSKGS
jgi:hypothetical protein